MDKALPIFLSYASPDQERVDEYYKHLKAGGFAPWMDKYEILGGQNWDFEIKKALKRAPIIVVFLSNKSVTKRGYCQREIKIALDKAQEKLINDVYIVPVALDPNLIIPGQLENIHVIKSDKVDAFAELSRSISSQLEELGEHQSKVEETTGIRWSVETLSEQWEGLPGFEFKYDILRLTSYDFPDVSKISDILRGDAMAQLLAERRIKFEQSPEIYNFGQDRFRRQNTTEVSCRAPIITNRVLSIVQEIYWYGSRAAHPNHGFATLNFVYDPLLRFDGIEEVFKDVEKGFSVVQREVRRLLAAIENEGERLLDDQWLMDGTAEWEHFHDYAFTGEGLLILFGPYQVGPYAHGSHSVVVPYAEIVTYFKAEVAAALGIEHLA